MGSTSKLEPALITKVGALTCAIPIAHVVETMRPLPVEPIGAMPACVLGLAIVRGVPAPVIDAARLLGVTPGESSRFVALRMGERAAVLVVDAVVDVRRFATSELVALPRLVRADAIAELGAADGDNRRRARSRARPCRPTCGPRWRRDDEWSSEQLQRFAIAIEAQLGLRVGRPAARARGDRRAALGEPSRDAGRVFAAHRRGRSGRAARARERGQHRRDVLLSPHRAVSGIRRAPAAAREPALARPRAVGGLLDGRGAVHARDDRARAPHPGRDRRARLQIPSRSRERGAACTRAGRCARRARSSSAATSRPPDATSRSSARSRALG